MPKINQEQLEDLYDSAPRWIAVHNQEHSWSGKSPEETVLLRNNTFDNTGSNLNIYIDPADVPRAIIIINNLFNQEEYSGFPMEMHIISKNLLQEKEGTHQAAITLFFDEHYESHPENKQTLINFLNDVSNALSESKIKAAPIQDETTDPDRMSFKGEHTIKCNYFNYPDQVLTPQPEIKNTKKEKYEKMMPDLVKAGEEKLKPGPALEDAINRTNALRDNMTSKLSEEVTQRELTDLIDACKEYYDYLQQEHNAVVSRARKNLIAQVDNEGKEPQDRQLYLKINAIRAIQSSLESYKQNGLKEPANLVQVMKENLPTLAKRRERGNPISSAFWALIDKLREKLGLPPTVAFVKGAGVANSAVTYFAKQGIDVKPEAENKTKSVFKKKQ